MQKQSGFRRLRSSRTADTTEWNHMKNISPQVHVGVAASHLAAVAAFSSVALAPERQNLRSVWWSGFHKARSEMCACSRNTNKERQELMRVASADIHTVHVGGYSPPPRPPLRPFSVVFRFL